MAKFGPPMLFQRGGTDQHESCTGRLRSVLRDIEASLGRVRTADKFAPRPIDLDIALFGQLVVDLEGSPIPDPDLAPLPHVALPLADIAPEWILPATGETLAQIAARLAITRNGEPYNYEKSETHQRQQFALQQRHQTAKTETAQWQQPLATITSTATG